MSELEADITTDVLVVGAGPAGIAAANQLARRSVDVVVVDENQRPGGQIDRMRFDSDADDPERPTGGTLESEVAFLGSTVCHGFASRGRAVLSRDGHGHTVDAKRVIVATGGQEVVYPIPGWTLPGVMTAGAAQTLLKGSGDLPYRRVVVAGSGPLLLATACQLLDHGVEVATVVDCSRPSITQWRDALRTCAAPSLLGQGARYLARLRRAGVRLRFGSGVRRIEGRRSVGGAWIGPMERDWSHVGDADFVECDSVLLCHGFTSVTELVTQAGGAIRWDERRRDWVPERDETFRTTAYDVRAIGDCAGVAGAQVAELEGKLAGVWTATELTGGRDDSTVAHLRRRLRRLEHFRAGMDNLFRTRPGAGGVGRSGNRGLSVRARASCRDRPCDRQRGRRSARGEAVDPGGHGAVSGPHVLGGRMRVARATRSRTSGDAPSENEIPRTAIAHRRRTGRTEDSPGGHSMTGYGLLVGGEEVPARDGRTIVSRDPADDTIVGTVPAADEHDVDRAVRAAGDACVSWRETPAADRGRLLCDVARRIRADAEDLARLETRDCGKTLTQARDDVRLAARYFEFFGGAAAVAGGEQIPVGPQALAFTSREPHGVCAQINAWNFPLNMAARSLAPALAAGNAVVVKTPELAPLTTAWLGRILTAAGSPPGVVNIVHGNGSDTGATLAGHPDVDLITFTGSATTGRLVAQTAAARLTPTVMELGGKSPTVVFDDADLDAGATRARVRLRGGERPEL